MVVIYPYAITFAPGELIITQAGTTATLEPSVTEPPAGGPLRLTVTVTADSPSAAIPDGTVTFSDGSTVLCADVALDAAGQATCDLIALSPGQHNLHVTYTGNANFSASSAGLLQTVRNFWLFLPVILQN